MYVGNTIKKHYNNKIHTLCYFSYRKSGTDKDKCLIAQEMLHPECAQRTDGPAEIPCNFLAESCRAKSDCR